MWPFAHTNAQAGDGRDDLWTEEAILEIDQERN
jgi:hypothetical protein